MNDQDLMNLFQEKLKRHYRSKYAFVEAMLGGPKHVTEVWFPLKLVDGITKKKENSGAQVERFDHTMLLKRLADEKSYKVAVVKGDSGTGKTTLVKKIAYDWAEGECKQLDMVLAIPLRYAEKTNDFLQLAVGYYGKKWEMPTDKLLKMLENKHEKILICLDGLDEYKSWNESPFKNLFGTLFEKQTNFSQSEPVDSSCQLLITSRPYAAKTINEGFSPYIYEIASLDEKDSKDYIQRYCETEDGKLQVNKYIDDTVIGEPLILTIICHLTEAKKEIPANWALLYKALVRNLREKAIQRGNLSEQGISWKDSAVVQSTAKLAYDGCKAQKYEFLRNGENVIDDSLVCGFLLYKNDFDEDEEKAEFRHRQIQEFFAALHCCQLILTADKTERNSVMKEVINFDSHFARFFFGICSIENRFEEMLEWLNPTLADAEWDREYPFDPIFLLNLYPYSLTDCSETDKKRFGQRLATSLDQLETKIQNRKKKIVLNGEDLELAFGNNNKSFISGLELKFLFMDDGCWCIPHVDKPNLCHLCYVYSAEKLDLRHDNFDKRFDEISILMWKWGGDNCTSWISSLSCLPPVSTMILQFVWGGWFCPQFEVNFDLNYELTTTTTTPSLRNFSFRSTKYHISSLISGFDENLPPGERDAENDLTGETSENEEKAEISWLTVSVSGTLDQTQVVKALILYAMGMYSNSKQRAAIKKHQDKIVRNKTLVLIHPKAADGETEETKGHLELAPTRCDESRVKAEFNESLMYRNFSKPKGLALIISNRKFHKPKNWPTRFGTNVDAGKLAKLWEKFGYSVDMVENLTAPEMQEKMAKFAKDKRHHQCDSAVVALLSHGTNGLIAGIDGKLVAIDQLISCIDAKNCKALIKKPKLVIIQACRGNKHDKGQSAEPDRMGAISTESHNEQDSSKKTDSCGQHSKKTPTKSDILIAYATPTGFISWRHKKRGSLFIEALCLVFEKFAHKEHVGDLLVMVNQKVAENSQLSRSMQIPEPNNRLTKKFFIYPGVTWSSSENP